MRLLTSAICTTVAVGLLAGCSGNLGSSSSSLPSSGSAQSARVHTGAHGELSLVPSWAHPAGLQRLHLGTPVSPDKKSKEIYASEFYGSNVYGYKNPNSSNAAPNCTISSQSYVNGIGSDTKGELLVPTGSPSGINVFKKGGCGALDWSQTDSTGQAADATAIKASSKVYVGEIANYTSGVGDIVICTKTGGCGTPVTNSSIASYGAGVAIDKAGDCWMSSFNSGGTPIIVYWKACSGSGQTVTGYSASSYGGLFVDTHGDLGAIDLTGTLRVYKGCNPGCTLVGTSTLQGESLFGGLDSKGKTLAVGDFLNGTVDVYAYNATNGTATFSYSFNNSLS
ncbi:MAG TPA: hypothetical protein VHR97_10465, partial [Candidatus Baltobacteraceae bacterium]|nr:hypothetical protein [Candidatus Baltobacteraceae bacterium]